MTYTDRSGQHWDDLEESRIAAREASHRYTHAAIDAAGLRDKYEEARRAHAAIVAEQAAVMSAAKSAATTSGDVRRESRSIAARFEARISDASKSVAAICERARDIVSRMDGAS